jgi:hypothetical protein
MLGRLRKVSHISRKTGGWSRKRIKRREGKQGSSREVMVRDVMFTLKQWKGVSGQKRHGGYFHALFDQQRLSPLPLMRRIRYLYWKTSRARKSWVGVMFRS